MVYFETGLMKIKGEVIKIQEITINASRDLTPVYNSDSHDAEEIRKGRKKIEFTIKRALDKGKLSLMYENGCEFGIIIYNNDTNPPQAIMALDKCVLSKDSIGNFDGSKPVTQDIEGQASSRRLLFNDISKPKSNVC